MLLEEGVCYDQRVLNIVYLRSTCSPWDESAVQLLTTGELGFSINGVYIGCCGFIDTEKVLILNMKTMELSSYC